MKKIIKLISLLVAVSIGLMFWACSDDSTGGGGTLTVTDIPAEYIGKYAVVMAGEDSDKDESEDGIMVLGAASVNDDGKGGKAVKIASGSVSLPTWTMSESGIVPYSGNDTLTVQLMIFDQEIVDQDTKPILESLLGVITFNNGNATIKWAEATLTVTGIPATHNGKYILFMSDDEGGGGEPVPGSVFILGAQSVDITTMAATLVQIQNGTAQLPMHKVTFTEDGLDSETYSSTESLSGEVTISSTNTTSPGNDTQPLAGKKFSSIQFTNGGASINWANGTDLKE